MQMSTPCPTLVPHDPATTFSSFHLCVHIQHEHVLLLTFPDYTQLSFRVREIKVTREREELKNSQHRKPDVKLARKREFCLQTAVKIVTRLRKSPQVTDDYLLFTVLLFNANQREITIYLVKQSNRQAH